jgi:hypothetical protein
LGSWRRKGRKPSRSFRYFTNFISKRLKEFRNDEKCNLPRSSLCKRFAKKGKRWKVLF